MIVYYSKEIIVSPWGYIPHFHLDEMMISCHNSMCGWRRLHRGRIQILPHAFQSQSVAIFSKTKFSLTLICISMTASRIHISVLKAVCDISIHNDYNIALLKHALISSRNYIIRIKIHFKAVFYCMTHLHNFLLVEFVLKISLGISFCIKFYRKKR